MIRKSRSLSDGFFLKNIRIPLYFAQIFNTSFFKTEDVLAAYRDKFRVVCRYDHGFSALCEITEQFSDGFHMCVIKTGCRFIKKKNICICCER